MKYSSAQSGFTLVETLVAITILLMVISTPLAITSNSAKSSSFSSEQVTAFFLAQEGVELVGKARDDLLVSRFAGTNINAWSSFTNVTGSGLYRNCFTSVNSSGCDLTINSGTNGTLQVTNCQTSGACQLSLNTTANNVRARFNHNHTATGNVFTPFTRVITLERISDGSGNVNEVKITSKVTWRTGSIKAGQEVVVESRLFNVYGN